MLVENVSDIYFKAYFDNIKVMKNEYYIYFLKSGENRKLQKHQSLDYSARIDASV